MQKHVLFSLISAALVASCAFATPAFATPITQTIDLNQVYTGASPVGAAPWLTAQFAFSPGESSGVLTLQSNLSGAGFVQGTNGVSGWGFNLSSEVFSAAKCTSGTCASTVTESVNSGPVPGGFNLGFGWAAGNRFDEADSATYTLTFNSPLGDVSPFVANSSGWTSYAHVQGINGASCSGFVVNGTGTTQGVTSSCGGGGTPVAVPEPGVLGIFGLGLLAVAGLVVFDRQRPKHTVG